MPFKMANGLREIPNHEFAAESFFLLLGEFGMSPGIKVDVQVRRLTLLKA
jgi:hypothetical protein